MEVVKDEDISAVTTLVEIEGDQEGHGKGWDTI